jgi:hypothetical protein
MWKFVPVLALLGACTLNIPDEISIDGPGGDGSEFKPFAKIVNKSGSNLDLVGADAWQFGDALWGTDCAADLLDDLSIDVVGDTLVIDSADTVTHHDCAVEARADDKVDEVDNDGDGDLGSDGTVTGIHGIHVNGNGNLTLGHVVTDELTLDARGNGEISIANLEADSLILDVSGNGDAMLAGAVDEGDFTVSGSGNLAARDLIVADLVISLTGTGDATVTATDTIDGTVSGNGDLDVYGDATGDVRATGTGEVTFHDREAPSDDSDQ